MNTTDFNKQDINIFIRQKYVGDIETLQYYKAIWTSPLTNEKAKSTSTRRLLCPNCPQTWVLIDINKNVKILDSYEVKEIYCDFVLM